MAKIKSLTYKPVMMSTFSGGVVDIANLKDEDIHIEDIAHSLSNLCRYNGHTSKFYSVAEHSVRLAHYAYHNYNKDLAKYLLLHDATEAYVGDVIYHLKRKLPEFSHFEAQVAKAIHKKFNLNKLYEATAHELDRRICFDEMYFLFNGQIDPYFIENNIQPFGADQFLMDNKDYIGWTNEEAKKIYLRFAGLLGLIKEKVND